MKISELIQRLQAEQVKHGDIPVYWLDDDYVLRKTCRVERILAPEEEPSLENVGRAIRVMREMGASAPSFVLIG